MTEFSDRGGGQLFCGILLHDVLRQRDHGACRAVDLPRKLLKQIPAPGDREHAYPLQRECLCYGAANPGTGSTHHGDLGLEIELHVRRLSRVSNKHACQVL